MMLERVVWFPAAAIFLSSGLAGLFCGFFLSKGLALA
jgi:hypothetical protein